jgi:hypothetical protein
MRFTKVPVDLERRRETPSKRTAPMFTIPLFTPTFSFIDFYPAVYPAERPTHRRVTAHLHNASNSPCVARVVWAHSHSAACRAWRPRAALAAQWEIEPLQFRRYEMIIR